MQLGYRDYRAVLGAEIYSIADAPQFVQGVDYASLLSGQERRRADLYSRAMDRDGYICGRYIVKSVICERYNCDPSDISISIGTDGKPFFNAPNGMLPFWFNISHSRGYVMITTSSVGPVGIDVQWGDMAVDTDAVAKTFFHDEEMSYLQRLPREERDEAFYALWVRKEAYLKATGLGIGGGSLKVQCYNPALEDRSPVLLQGQDGFCWRITDLSVPSGYFAAVCIACPLNLDTSGAPFNEQGSSVKSLRRGSW